MDIRKICFSCMGVLPEERGVCPSCGYDNLVMWNKSHQLPFSRIGSRYLVGRVMGQGGFGITYVGLDLTLNRKVAIKEYYPRENVSRIVKNTIHVMPIGDEDERIFLSGREKFVAEARTMAEFCDVDNVVRVTDHFMANNTAYIVMDFVQGSTVKATVAAAGGKFSYKKTIALMLPIARALKKIHDGGIIHRDISPDNIIIRESDGKPILIDFGAARKYSADESRDYSVYLKQGFAPLEQYSKTSQQGMPTDVYAMCATMYFMMTGKMPAQALERSINKHELIPPSRLCPEIPAKVESVLLKGMEMDAENRYQDMGALTDALEKALSKAQAKTETPKPRATKPWYRQRKIVLPAVGAVLLTAGIVVLMSLRDIDPRTATHPATPSPAATATHTPAAMATLSPAATATHAPAAMATPSPAATATPTPAVTATHTPTPAPSPTLTVAPDPVAFQDPEFEKMVRTLLKKPDSPIYPSQLRSLSTLFIAGDRLWGTEADYSFDRFDYARTVPGLVTSLEDLRWFPNLQRIYICNQPIADFSPLAGVEKLSLLALQGMPFGFDTSTLYRTRNLTHLSLTEMHISDISTLAGLEKLRELKLNDNAIEDISPLAGLTNLTGLWLDGNRVTDLSPLAGLRNLEVVRFDNNCVTDFSALAGFTKLRELNLLNWDMPDDEKVSGDISALLAGNRHLTSLELRNVPIPDPSMLGSLKQLEYLRLFNCDIQEAAFLANMPRLTALELSGARVDPAVLAKLHLDQLTLEDAGLSDISFLAEMQSLTNLNVSRNPISDFSPLESLTNLEWLSLENTGLSDLSFLSGMKNLRGLGAGSNSITDISPLAGLTNLMGLWMYGNRVTNLSPLARLRNLEMVVFGGNLVTDVSPLVGLTKLRELNLLNWDMSDDEKVTGDITAVLAGNPHLLMLELRNVPIPDPSVLDSLEQLEHLHLFNCDIQEAAFLANMPRLIALELTGARVDPAALAKLHLYQLTLEDAGLSDISFLAEMQSLTNLNVSQNPISDFSPLASLTNMDWLSLDNTGLSDLSFVTGMKKLRGLGASGNNITDISPLAGLTNLTALWMHGNRVADLSPLAGLRNLEIVVFDNNRVTDFSPLAGLTKLRELNLINWDIADDEKVLGDITALLVENPHLESLQLRNVLIPDPAALSKLSEMQILRLLRAGINDFSFLSNMPQLMQLELNESTSIDLSCLSKMTELGSLTLHNFKSIENISALRGLPNLVELALLHTPTDPVFLTDLRHLTRLVLSNANLKDITFAEGMQNLTKLDLSDNQITDISPIAGLGNLEELYLDHNPIKSLPALPNLRHLRTLSLWSWGNEFGRTTQGDISYLLANNPGLTRLALDGIKISDPSVLTGLKNLNHLSLHAVGLKDCSFLWNMPELQWMELFEIPFGAPPSEYTSGLRSLALRNTRINANSYEQLAGLKDLTELAINNCGLKDITPLSALTGLTLLDLRDNQIQDISPLSALTRLIWLDLSQNRIKNWTPVEHVENVDGRP